MPTATPLPKTAGPSQKDTSTQTFAPFHSCSQCRHHCPTVPGPEDPGLKPQRHVALGPPLDKGRATEPRSPAAKPPCVGAKGPLSKAENVQRYLWIREERIAALEKSLDRLKKPHVRGNADWLESAIETARSRATALSWACEDLDVARYELKKETKEAEEAKERVAVEKQKVLEELKAKEEKARAKEEKANGKKWFR